MFEVEIYESTLVEDDTPAYSWNCILCSHSVGQNLWASHVLEIALEHINTVHNVDGVFICIKFVTKD